MKRSRFTGVYWIGSIAAAAICAVVLSIQTPTQAVGESAAPVSPSAFLTTLGIKFEGSPTCSAVDCHGAEKSVDKKNRWGNEYTLWHGRKDPHHTAFRTLLNAKSKTIAAALKIPVAKSSERCLNCHSTLAVGSKGEDLKGQEYSAAEGVSCNSCHGPSQKYREPHQKVNWIDDQRKALSHEQLLTTVGIYDTVPTFERAARCTSCHLAMEPELVAAGHPQPAFEMNYYSNMYADRHWHDPAGSFPAQLWATGQLAEIRDAMLQVASHAASKSPTAAAEYTNAYNQAMAHISVFYALFSTRAVSSPDIAGVDAAVKKLVAATTAKDMAGAGAAALAAAEQIKSKGLVTAVGAFTPDAAMATKVLSALAATDTGKLYGPRGEEQQAYAISALAAAAGNAPIAQALAPIWPAKASDPVKSAEFAKALADIRAKLPK